MKQVLSSAAAGGEVAEGDVFLEEVLVGLALLMHLSQGSEVGTRLGSPAPDSHLFT